MELKINVANNNNINCTHLATKGLHLNLGITKFFNDVQRLRVSTRENPSIQISTAEKNISKAIENTKQEKKIKTITSL